MFKNLHFALACLLISTSSFAQLNVTFRSQLTFPGKSLANIWGYTDNQNREYALVGTTAGLSIVNITSPATPALLFDIPAANSQWREVRTYGSYAYVGTEGGGGLTIVNLSYLPDSAPYKTWTGNGAITGLSRIHTVHVDGNFIYLNGCRNSGGGYLFNGSSLICSLTDPWNPSFVGHTSTGASSTVDYVHDGQALGNVYYGAHIYDGKFSIYDVTNKAAPVLINKQATPNTFCHNTWLNGAQTVVFTTDEVSNSVLASYNVSNSNNIQLLDKVQSQNPGSGSIIHNTYILNEYAVNSYYRDGFTIVDVSRPGNLVLTGWYDTSPAYAGNGFNGAWGVYPYFPSGNVVVSDIENGLFVLKPTYTRACHLEGAVTDQQTGLVIAGATVSITGPATLNEVTNATGEYKTGTVTAGTYTVTVSKTGYVTKVTSGVVLTNGSLTTLNITLLQTGSTCTDTYEANNSSSQAKTIPVSTDIYALIGASGDVDWFRFSTVIPNTKLKATLQNLPADYDLRLYSNSNSLLATSQNSGTTNESIIRNSTTASTYKLRVNGYNGAFNANSCYKLRVDVSSTNFVKTMPLNQETAKYGDEGSLLAYPNPADNDIAFYFTSEMQTNGSLRVYDMLGKVISQSEIEIKEGDNLTQLSLQAMNQGMYIVEINNGTTSYKTRIVKN
ncbi:MAG: choice-of-anchor B family protein [Bacteroidetes bacterium]|nr:choice-of-anchor B family protein [Bacteroidota bacterium]